MEESKGAASAWNRGGSTWEEKKIEKWAMKLLKESLLPELSYMLPNMEGGTQCPPLPATEDSGGAPVTVSVRVAEADKVDGEATYVVSRGKQRVVFELTMKLGLEMEVSCRLRSGGVPRPGVFAQERPSPWASLW